MLTLPEEHRRLFKEPFGKLYNSIDELKPLIAGKTVYAVGDVVTHNLQKSGITPAIAIVDGYTMRSPCRKMPKVIGECIRVKNPAGTVTDDLIRALDYAVLHQPATIIVEGEEDLAVIPMVIAAQEGAVVLYGQPNEGVVLRSVTCKSQETARNFLTHFTHSDD